ncbi:oligosaccharide repeat unit polymerase [Micromonospora nigra]|uniref:Oligosaccharide repeat unit polymerase n=1 Tax=Micromonospora nigra TaxID=145857 RepID=A0A1C6SSW4_9ACTN|nr:O-antigen polymerase [Micromonospora nigra]SCL32734.1 oligosaccharide repeat unit polymerase [Micromonospora nigra]
MITLFLPVLVLAAVHYSVAMRRYGLLTPDGLFVVCQLLMLYGTVRLVDTDSDTEVFYARLMAAAVALYLVASMTTSVVMQRTSRRRGVRAAYSDYSVTLVAPTGAILFVIAVSAVVTVAYFTAVGYSAFFLGLQGQLDGAPADIANLRLDSYAGEDYLFPGFVNQFKNAILPALTLVVAVWSFSRGGLFARAGSIVLIALSAVALLGTGQRGAMVVFLTTAIVYAYLHNRRRLPRAAVLPIVLGLPLVMLSTYVLARRDGQADSPLRAVTNDLVDRFVHDNQASGIAAFNYTSMLPVRNGGEWLEGLLSILPGHRGSTLSSEIFYTVYWSTRGTSPPSLWGSIHYNFDTVGLIFLAVLFGVLLQILTQRSLRRGRYNSLQLVGFAGITVVLGTWIAGGIETPMNVGLFSYLGLWYWGGRMGGPGRHSVVRADPAAATALPAGPRTWGPLPEGRRPGHRVPGQQVAGRV